MELLNDLGTVPENVKDMLEKQGDVDKLNKWLKLAAKSTTIEEFEKNCDERL